MKLAPVLVAALLWSAATAQMEIRVPPDPLLVVGVAPDRAPGPGAGVVVVRGRYSSHLRLLDAATGQSVREVWLPAGTLQAVAPALSGDGRWLAVMLTPDPSGAARVGLLDLAAASLPGAGPGTERPPTYTVASPGLQGTLNLALNRDGTRLAAGNRQGYVQLWDARAGRRLATIPTDTKLEPVALQFSPDGCLFAPMFRGQTKTRVFDALTAKPLVTLGGVGVGTFAPDSRGFLASRGRLIGLPEGREVPAPDYLRDVAGVVGASTDGTRILVRRAGTDGQGREWLELREVGTGRTLGTLTRIPDGWPEFLSPDGTALIGGDGQGGVRFLPLAPR